MFAFPVALTCVPRHIGESGRTRHPASPTEILAMTQQQPETCEGCGEPTTDVGPVDVYTVTEPYWDGVLPDAHRTVSRTLRLCVSCARSEPDTAEILDARIFDAERAHGNAEHGARWTSFALSAHVASCDACRETIAGHLTCPEWVRIYTEQYIPAEQTHAIARGRLAALRGEAPCPF